MQPPATTQHSAGIHDYVHPQNQQELDHPHEFCSLCMQALNIWVPTVLAVLHLHGVRWHGPSLLAGPYKELSCGPSCTGLWHGRGAGTLGCSEEPFIGALGSKKPHKKSSLSDTARPWDSFQPYSTGCGMCFLSHCPMLVPQRNKISGSSAWEDQAY